MILTRHSVSKAMCNNFNVVTVGIIGIGVFGRQGFIIDSYYETHYNHSPLPWYWYQRPTDFCHPLAKITRCGVRSSGAWLHFFLACGVTIELAESRLLILNLILTFQTSFLPFATSYAFSTWAKLAGASQWNSSPWYHYFHPSWSCRPFSLTSPTAQSDVVDTRMRGRHQSIQQVR